MENSATLARNSCSAQGQVSARQSEFEFDTQPCAEAKHSLKLLKEIRVPWGQINDCRRYASISLTDIFLGNRALRPILPSTSA